VSKFIKLTDVPNSYSGKGGEVVVVKADESGLEFTPEGIVDDHKVLAASADDTAGYLIDKLGVLEPLQINYVPDSGGNMDVISMLPKFSGAFSWLPSIISFFDPTSGLPVSPSDGDRHIASATANGWTKNYLYMYSTSSHLWLNLSNDIAQTVYNKDDKQIYSYDGTDWKIPVLVDQAAATGSLRTLGTGAQQSAPGNIIVSVNNAIDEAAAFAAGSLIVIRTDLI
jgi:hypothetical protein